MEKKRRARINDSLTELKNLVLQALNRTVSSVSRETMPWDRLHQKTKLSNDQLMITLQKQPFQMLAR